MSSENSELVMLRLNYDIEKLKHFIYAAEQSKQEAIEIIAELKAKNKKLKELLETRCYNEVEFENKKLKEALEKIKSFFNPEYNDYQTNTIKKMMKDIIDEVLKNENE